MFSNDFRIFFIFWKIFRSVWKYLEIFRKLRKWVKSFSDDFTIFLKFLENLRKSSEKFADAIGNVRNGLQALFLRSPQKYPCMQVITGK